MTRSQPPPSRPLLAGAAPSPRCRCGATLPVPPTAGCGRCGSPAAVDDLGILRLAAGDRTWRDVSPEVADQVRHAATPGHLLDAMLDPSRPWPIDLRRRLLHRAGGIAAALVPMETGSRVLDLATGWSTLGSVCGFFGATVVGADWVYPRLRFSVLTAEPALAGAVHLDPGPLPWPDGCFDVICLDLAEIDPAAAAGILAEVRRVLAPGGSLVAGTTNPRGRWRGRLRRPWWPAPLRRAGFTPGTVHVPYPRREYWQRLIPLELLAGEMATLPWDSPKRRLASRLGLAAWAVPEYYVVAHAASSPPRGGTPLAESIAGRPAVAHSRYVAAAVLIDTPDEFVKVPLSAEQEALISAEIVTTERARSTPFARYVAPAARLVPHGEFSYSTTARIRGRNPASEETGPILARILDDVTSERHGVLGDTDLWSRITAPPIPSNVEALGVEGLRQRVLAGGGEATLPVGPVHGDLWHENVLIEEGGRLVLVDWEYHEGLSPLFLDPLGAALSEEQQRAGVDLAQALCRFVDGAIPGPMPSRARQLLGELPPLAGAALCLLHDVTRLRADVRRHSPWAMDGFAEAAAALLTRFDGTAS